MTRTRDRIRGDWERAGGRESGTVRTRHTPHERALARALNALEGVPKVQQPASDGVRQVASASGGPESRTIARARAT